MLNNYDKFDFFILKKLLNLPHEHLVDIYGGLGIGINIYACQPNLEISIHVLKTALGHSYWEPLETEVKHWKINSVRADPIVSN